MQCGDLRWRASRYVLQLSKWGRAPPRSKKTHLYQGGGSFPLVCKEHIHTGIAHARINNSMFKNPNVMSFQWEKKKNKTEKPDNGKKIIPQQKIKTYENKLIVTKR